LGQRGGVVDTSEDRRLDVVAPREFATEALPARDQVAGALADGYLDHPEDAVGRALTDHRTEHHVRVERVADRRAFDDGHELLHERVVHRFVHQHTARACAALPGLHEWTLVRRQHRGGVQIGVTEYEVGRLTAEFGHHRCQIGRRRLNNLAGACVSAGEVNLADARVSHEGVTTLGPRRHDINETGGSPASMHSSPKRSAANGATSDGFSTTAFPAASAGATQDPITTSAPFHGVITPTTP
jgi:hypothetical protein